MHNSTSMRNLDKQRINKYVGDRTFIKYLFREKIEHLNSSFLNIVHNNEEYFFSIERLTIRKFTHDDYKKNNNRKIFNNSSFRIALYLEGESQIYIHNKLENIDSSILFLQSPGEQISLTPKVPSNCTILEFYFDLTNSNKKQIDLNFIDYINKLFGINIKISKEINLINATAKNELQNLFLNLYDKLLEFDISGIDSRTDLIIFDIFNKISNILSPEVNKEKNGNLNYVIRELKHNYKKNYTIDELAKIASLSKHYFQNLFKKTYGITPLNYLIQIRINHAKFMLKNYNYSCNEISYSVGFNSPLYFSKVFKKYTGVSPTKYRLTYRDMHKNN